MTDPAAPVSRPPGKPKLFDCPACGGSIQLNAAGHSIRAVCAHCGSLVDTTNENWRLIQRAHEKLRPSLLPLGTRGTLDGKRWQVIGWIEKKDRASLVSWDEFLLFNPFYGFRFLVQADGHWSLLTVIKQDMAAPAGLRSLEFNHRHYTLFQDGKTEVTYVAGEFYWRVKRGETSEVHDFITPPFLLSIERADGEINIAHGEYLEPKIIASAFGLRDRLPDRRGVAPNQPSPYAAALRAIITPSLLFTGAALLIQLGALAIADNETLIEKQFVVRAGEANQTIVIPDLHLSDKLADVVVETSSRLNNQWMEVDFQLVNDKTNQNYLFRNAMDYYHGYDGDESWSEGSNHTDTVLSMVPGGNYTLIADTDSSPPAPGQNLTWSLRLRRDVTLWSNFWTAMAVALMVPLYLGIRYVSFERKRWSQSDYAPAIYRESEDDESD